MILFRRELAFADADEADAEIANKTVLVDIMAYKSLSTAEYWDFGDYNISINISNLVR